MAELDPDVFDEELENSQEQIDRELERKIDELRTKRPSKYVEDIVLTSEVARAIMEGVPDKEIAKTLGLTINQFRRWKGSLAMEELLQIESRRIVTHLSQRNLNKEKYLGLATALGGFIEKTRLLREEPTHIHKTIGSDTADRIRVALFGIGGRRIPKNVGPDTQRSLDAGRPEEPIPVEAEPDTGD